MVPFNAPNPYGSYFNFGEPESMAASIFRPPAMGNLDPSVMSMMGASSGGFNPTSNEYWLRRTMDRNQQMFMSSVMQSDPRVNAVSHMLLGTTFGKDTARQSATINRLGGMGNFNDMIGFLMSQPGIAGYLGGSPRSLGVGAMSIATSGMSVNGFNMSGYGRIQQTAAEGILKQVRGQFYNPGGGAILSQTQGLNMDQIGGIMSLAGSQGAFSGLNMGAVDRAGSFKLDQGTIEKITKFTKQATKAISSLIDIYGNGSIGELAQKAQQITGLDFSRFENASIISSRLQTLRQTGRVTGLDVTSMMDMASSGVRSGMAMGLAPESAGNFAFQSANQAAYLFRSKQQNVNGFYMAPTSREELMASMMRDAHGMMRDPVGARRSAVELMIQSGTVSASQAEAVRAEAAGLRRGGEGAFDQSMAGRFGQSPTQLLRIMGGAQHTFEALDDQHKSIVRDANTQEFNTRQVRMIRDMAITRLGRGGAGGMAKLMGGLSQGSVYDITSALDRGAGRDEIAKIVGSDLEGATDVSAYTDAALKMREAVGGRTSLGGAAREMSAAMRSHPLLGNFQTAQARRDQLDRDWHSRVISDDVRGKMGAGGFIAGLTDRLLGNTTEDQFAYLADISPGSIAGQANGSLLKFDRALYTHPDGSLNTVKATALANTMRAEFGRTPEGKRLLQNLFGSDLLKLEQKQVLTPGGAAQMLGRLNDQFSRAELFSEFNSMTGVDARGESYAIFAPRNKLDLAGRLGRISTAANFLAQGMSEESRATRAHAKSSMSGYSGLMGRISDDLRQHIAGKKKLANGQLVDFNLSEQDIERYTSSFDQFINNPRNLLGLSDKVFRDIAHADHSFAREMATSLNTRLGNLTGDNSELAKAEKSDLEKRLQILEKEGVSPDGGSIQKLSGTLKLIGDNLVLQPDARLTAPGP